MSENSYIEEQEPKQESWSIFKKMEKAVKFNKLFEEGLPVKYLPQVLFMSCALILYIGNTHYADRIVRELENEKSQVNDLRADFTTLKSELMYASKQSEVAKKVKVIGLQESSRPPYKIIIQKDEY